MASTFNLIIYLPGTLCDVLVAVFTFFSTVLTHLSAVLALLELLQQLAGPLDVAGQRETLLHVGHRILKKSGKVHHSVTLTAAQYLHQYCRAAP